MTTPDTLLVACISQGGSTLYLEASDLASFTAYVDGEDDTMYELRFKNMTRQDFEALGEFDGF